MTATRRVIVDVLLGEERPRHRRLVAYLRVLGGSADELSDVGGGCSCMRRSPIGPVTTGATFFTSGAFDFFRRALTSAIVRVTWLLWVPIWLRPPPTPPPKPPPLETISVLVPRALSWSCTADDEPLPDGDEHDHGADADQDPEHGECRPHAVGVQPMSGDAEAGEEGHPAVTCSAIGAVMWSSITRPSRSTTTREAWLAISFSWVMRITVRPS